MSAQWLVVEERNGVRPGEGSLSSNFPSSPVDSPIINELEYQDDPIICSWRTPRLLRLPTLPSPHRRPRPRLLLPLLRPLPQARPPVPGPEERRGVRMRRRSRRRRHRDFGGHNSLGPSPSDFRLLLLSSSPTAPHLQRSCGKLSPTQARLPTAPRSPSCPTPSLLPAHRTLRPLPSKELHSKQQLTPNRLARHFPLLKEGQTTYQLYSKQFEILRFSVRFGSSEKHQKNELP